MRYLQIVLLAFFIFPCISLMSESDIQSDGSFRMIPYEPGQAKELTVLTNDILLFQKRIAELLPYLVRAGKIKNGSYSQEVPGRMQWQVQGRKKYLVNKIYTLETSGQGANTKLTAIKFRTRKALVSEMYEPTKEIGDLENTALDDEKLGSLELKISKHTVSGVEDFVYNLSNIREPSSRLELIQIYRYSLMEVIHSIDVYVRDQIEKDKMNVIQNLERMEIGGQYREPPK